MEEESEEMMTAVAAPIGEISVRRLRVRLAGCALVLAGDPSEAAHALAVRSALDSALVQEAARDRRGLEPSELDALLDAMDERRHDPLAFVRANWALHRRLAELTANPVLRNVYLAMLDIAEERLEDAVAGPGYPLRSLATIQVLRELVAAIAAGDVARARRVAGSPGVER